MMRMLFKWAGAVVVAVGCAGAAWGQVVVSGSTPNGEVGVAYPGASFSATDSGSPCSSCTFAVTAGSLPSGLTLNSDGSVTIGSLGATAVPGPTFTVTATDPDNGNATGSADFSITIFPALLITTTSPLPGGTQGVGYSAPLAATDGTGSYTWSLVSVSPSAPWLSVSGASLTASTPLAGTYSVTVQVNDSIATVSSSALTLVISPPPLVIATTSIPPGEATAVYNPPSGVSLLATGGTGSYTWSLDASSPPLPEALRSAQQAYSPARQPQQPL